LDKRLKSQGKVRLCGHRQRSRIDGQEAFAYGFFSEDRRCAEMAHQEAVRAEAIGARRFCAKARLLKAAFYGRWRHKNPGRFPKEASEQLHCRLGCADRFHEQKTETLAGLIYGVVA